MIVRSILGFEREPAQVFGDGSYTCPFCGAAVLSEWEPFTTREGYEALCRNPACEAGPTTRDAARLREQERKESQERAEQRERDAAAWQRRMDETRAAEKQRRMDLSDEALREGYCVRCILRSPSRRVRHRDPDYHSNR